MKIPFINLEAQYRNIKSPIDLAVKTTLEASQFVHGVAVSQFEKAFSNLIGVNHSIATGNCTDALFAILKNLNLNYQDEVITPAFSWISSAEVISLCGAKPVFIDAHPQSFVLNSKLIEDKITVKTKAIIAVHLYGQSADAESISAVCRKNNLFFIEDCAQAHLTEENGQYAGTFSNAAAFSFYPTKNLGAYGDAGCIVTNDYTLAEKMRRFGNHGALVKDDHVMEGINSRMDTIQAAILLAKLPYLKEWNQKRSLHATRYTDNLKEEENIVTPFVRSNTVHSFHIYAIRARRRNELREYLLKNGIQTMVHYPKSLPNLPAYRYLNHREEDFPVASALQNEVLSLPIYPELRQEEIDYICQKIKQFYHN